MTDLFKTLSTNTVNDHYTAQKLVIALGIVQCNGAKTRHIERKSYENVSLKKGQNVTLRSGKTVVVSEGCSDNYFWAGRDALPYSKAEIVG